MTYYDPYFDGQTDPYYDRYFPTGGAVDYYWPTLPGGILFDTAKTDSVVQAGGFTDSWSDVTGVITAVAGSPKPKWPHPQTILGNQLIDFDATVGQTLTAPIGVSSTDTYCIYFAFYNDAVQSGDLLQMNSAGPVTEVRLQMRATGALRTTRVAATSTTTQLISTGIVCLMYAYNGTSNIMRANGWSGEESFAVAAGTWTGTSSNFGHPASSVNVGMGVGLVYGGASGVPGSATNRNAGFVDFCGHFGVTP